MDLIGFTLATKLITAAVVAVPGTTSLSPGASWNWLFARVEGTTASVLSIYENGGTNATNRVVVLRAPANNQAELGMPVRVRGQVKAKMTTAAAATGYIYLR